MAGEVRTRVDPEWPGGAELHRGDCETNSYDNGPCDCGTGGLTAELLAVLVAEARQQLDTARQTDLRYNEFHPLASPGTRESEWLRNNPGHARLLDLTDRT